MPATNGLAPSLTPQESAIVKSYGDWTSFMQSYGLKPFESGDVAEAKRIVEQMAKQDRRG